MRPRSASEGGATWLCSFMKLEMNSRSFVSYLSTGQNFVKARISDDLVVWADFHVGVPVWSLTFAQSTVVVRRYTDIQSTKWISAVSAPNNLTRCWCICCLTTHRFVVWRTNWLRSGSLGNKCDQCCLKYFQISWSLWKPSYSPIISTATTSLSDNLGGVPCFLSSWVTKEIYKSSIK